MSTLVNVVNVFVDADGAFGNPLGIVWSSSSTRGREQEIAADLGFSETIFIDALAGREVRARIFTPAQQLRFAGHPTVGLAAWLRASGDEVDTIEVPAGSARIRSDGDRVFINAHVDWTPDFTLQQLSAPDEVMAVDADAYGRGAHFVWAWIDESGGRVRARMFAPDLGIREDQATGAAAIRLTAEVGRDLEIVQGEGSRLYTHLRYGGQQVEIGGRTSGDRTFELP